MTKAALFLKRSLIRVLIIVLVLNLLKINPVFSNAPGASRPGMCTTAILDRKLNREIINLGFSGSGKMEPELAEFLAPLDPVIYFIDCLPNLETAEVALRVEPFIRILRKVHPDTPIVIAESITYNDAFLVKSRDLRNTESLKVLNYDSW